MDKDELQERMTNFAVRIIKMVDAMPSSVSGLAKSDKDFVNKLKMVEEELDETSHWLTLIIRSGLLKPSRVEPLHQECCELLSIIVKS